MKRRRFIQTKNRREKRVGEIICLHCESENVTEVCESEEVRTNGEAMCVYVCDECDLEWKE